MVDKLVCAKLEDKQASNEGCDVEAHIVVVDHVEKSVSAWRCALKEEDGDAAVLLLGMRGGQPGPD